MKYHIGDVAVSGIVHAGQCIPSNDTLAEPVKAPFSELAGAFWGITPYVVIGIIVAGVILVIFNALGDKPQKWIKGMIIALSISLAAWFLVMIYFVITTGLPDVAACPF